MSYAIIRTFVLILLVSAPVWLEAQTDADKELARTLVQSYTKISSVPGMTVAVAKDGKIVYQESFGSADLENNSPAAETTRYRLGSVSKVITIAAAAKLHERGLLDIDAPIQTYVPTFPEQPARVTVRMLSGHLGGIRHYVPADFQLDSRHYDSVTDALSIFIKDPLVNTPGTTYFYSSYGYNLIAAALEKASGKNFEQVLREEVFNPLQMERACLDQVQQIIPGRTRFYSREKGGIGNASYQDPSSKWAAGGILGTASDLIAFGNAHLQDGYFNGKSRSLLFTSQKTTDGKETGVGFGWRIGTDWKGRKIYHHAGNMPGTRSVIVLYPELKTVAVVLTNLYGEPAFVERTAQMIAEPFLDPDYKTTAGADWNGTYKLSGEYGDKKPFAATLQITPGPKGVNATLQGTTPFSDAAAKNGFPSQVSIPRVIVQDRSIVLVFASALGLTEWRFEPAESGYTGQVEAMKATGTLIKQ